MVKDPVVMSVALYVPMYHTIFNDIFTTHLDSSHELVD